MKTLENTSDYKRDLKGSISCTFEHPLLGTIPNGLNPALDAELIVEIEKSGLVEELDQATKTAHEQAEARTTFKAERTAQVAALTITTETGNEFDADEISQGRMARAILSMDDTEVVVWVLADNTAAEASKAELIEALKLAGLAQMALWT